MVEGLVVVDVLVVVLFVVVDGLVVGLVVVLVVVLFVVVDGLVVGLVVVLVVATDRLVLISPIFK